MNGSIRLATGALTAACSSALGVDVLVLSSGNQPMDALVEAALEARGHTVTIGPEFYRYSGTPSPAGFDAVYLQANYNWSSGDMPGAGQSALLAYVNAGGGLVTCEWTIWKAGASAHFATLSSAFPSVITTSYTSRTQATITRDVFDPIMSAGLATQFTLPLTNIGGTETDLRPRPTAIVFFRSDAFTNAGAAIGRAYGAGRAINLNTTFGTSEVGDGNGATLLSNALNWAANAQVCYADCDTTSGARVLDIFDFLCFQTKFDQADPYACDCDQGSGPGVCDIFDFLCFQNAFAGGCP